MSWFLMVVPWPWIVMANCVPWHLCTKKPVSLSIAGLIKQGQLELQESEIAPLPDRIAGTYQALVLGLREYIEKNGFPGVVLGLSGGIDSAIDPGIGGRCTWS